MSWWGGGGVGSSGVMIAYITSSFSFFSLLCLGLPYAFLDCQCAAKVTISRPLVKHWERGLLPPIRQALNKDPVQVAIKWQIVEFLLQTSRLVSEIVNIFLDLKKMNKYMWARHIKHSPEYPGSGYPKSSLGQAFTRGQNLQSAALKPLHVAGILSY